MRKRANITLLLVMLTGLCLRLYQLGRETPSFEELRTFFYSFFNIPLNDLSALFNHWFSFGHLPTYFLIMHYWMYLFGTSEAIIRFPSLLCGTFSLYLIFLLGKKIFNERVGLLASYLLAVSTINIYYSQHARPYSMVVCFVLLSFLSFLEALRHNSRLAWSVYIASTLIALLLSASALPNIICQMLFVLISWPQYKRRPVAKSIIFAFALVLIIYLPFLTRLVLFSYKSGKFYPLSWLAKPTFNSVIYIVNLLGVQIYKEGPKYSLPINFFATLSSIFFLLLYIRGVFSSMSNYQQVEGMQSKIKLSLTAYLLLLWFWAPLILPFVLSYAIFPMFGEVRYVLYISIPYYLCVSKGIFSLQGKTRIIVVVLVVIAGIGALHKYYQTDKKGMNMKPAFSYLKGKIKNDERAAFIKTDNPMFHGEYRMMRYYSLPFVGISLSTVHPETAGVKPLEIYTPEQVPYKGLWIVTGIWPFSEEVNKECIKRIEKRYALLESIEKPLGGSRSYVVTFSHYRLKE